MTASRGEEPRLERVLVATRRPLARRLIRLFRERGVETVAAFGAAEAEAPWLEDADYDAYLGDGTSDRVWGEAQRLVSAAMDAGCDALHPGAEPVADTIELWSAAANANVAVIGGDPRRVPRVLEPEWSARARHLELPVLGGAAPAEARRVDVVVGCDQRGTVARLATLVQLGPGLWSAGRDGLTAGIGDLAERGTSSVLEGTAFVGLGFARWVVDRDGLPWLLGFHPRLPDTVDLVEAASGLDVVALQLTLSLGATCPASIGSRPALQARCSAIAGGVVSASRWSGGEVHALAGAEVAAGATLAVATAAGTTGDEARRALREALASAVLTGVDSDLGALRRQLADESSG